MAKREKIWISELCACGCGREIGDWSKRSDRNPPKFIKNHHLNYGRPKRSVILIDKPCACGCGQIIGEWLNRPSRKPPIYVGGHQLNNNPAIPRKINNHGYVIIHKPDYEGSYSNGYILEHRYVMEQKLGRRLDPSEDVHHKDGNKENNDPDNLEIIEHAEHSKLTRREEKEMKRRRGEYWPGRS